MASSPERGRSVKTSDSTTGGSGRSKSRGGKKKKGGKKKAPAIPKDMAMNANGELVPVKEYILEQTLSATTKSLDSYRERMTGLVHTNEDLQESCQQQEKDALEVIAALHRENEKREMRIKELRQQMEDDAQRAREERENVVENFQRKISDMSALVTEKEAACNVMQQEFSVIKDFRKKRHDLIKELEAQKQLMADTERRHSETVARMERKFFEEKIRLQKEVNRKISELATKAHKEAVANLGETEKEVFRQNIRISEALRYHVAEGEEMTKTNLELANTNRQLLEEKNLHDVIVKEKIMQAKQQAKEIKDLRLKIHSLEHTLSHVVREFTHERTLFSSLARTELDAVKSLAAKLQSSLSRKTKETRHIKRLAQHILDQRTDLEKFFMDALDHVRAEIREERDRERREKVAEYNRRMKAILAAKNLPPTTPSKGNPPASVLMPGGDPSLPNLPSLPPTTTTVTAPPTKIELSDLSWADKEKVMRLLFARMNGVSLVGKNGGDFAEAPSHSQQQQQQDQQQQRSQMMQQDDSRDDMGSYPYGVAGYEGRVVDIGDDAGPESWDALGAGERGGLGTEGGGRVAVSAGGGAWDDGGGS
ncbi:hypothetical protein PhCBS80983_g00426 [Powellomyces hirtus]|uniref:Basal body-orientation factor 1 n=1 Tax=Powellomyces hirtus TaxID=109895 RepID=A0A507EDV0_9FUNG|nr:hypothetical protein PhCBS80983_g00426 [Powellomyces hirtus]